MAEQVSIIQGDKRQQYEQLLPQIAAVIAQESNTIANMANVCALLKAQFDWLWIGFYLVDAAANNLVLGPFQGPLACTRIAYGKGVCGTSWKNKATIVVPDVNQFEGHIACSSLSKSEIVIPLLFQNHCWGVLDIDSDELNTFDETDQHFLEKIAALLSPTKA